ncbi:Type IIS restriction enzyme Eco57I [Halomicronema hongdechloris C2206]|uniref:site-specific DNA-methyltransferase (adenine-specific) n=1 Tax=Halomicronema hongdechloris C2206 TaxID=1641165 RepID=A0A1Z3HJ85_9CYAN|nr:N-6 DNA methylase [Halomicronema hongdechloris]ASC70355.1 Type IIS restriction enzyme Eco57I [Halomicronema hongdechloris C2206]
MRHSRNIFTTVRSEGAILPSDLLQRIVSGDKDLDGLDAKSFHLLEGDRINEAINRSWSRLRGAWVNFQHALTQLSLDDAATRLTREKFLLPLFQELGYGRLPPAPEIEVGGKRYTISHGWHHTPIHLVGYRVDLDKRSAGIAGAAKSSPHSLVQELLNRSNQHLWAFLANGHRLRILRDNASLTRQAYVEFDLEAMMAGEVYADFVLLWLLCHQSRVESESPSRCWLEKWSQVADSQGTRALEQLRKGVEVAISTLGQGFLSHPANQELRRLLQTGVLSAQEYNHQLRRLVYRLLFLFVVEDRDVLLDPAASSEAKERYQRYYSVNRLRSLADRHRGTRHHDLYQGLQVVMQHLGHEGCPALGLPALGSFLWSNEATPALDDCQLANSALLETIRALAFICDRNGRRPVDYKNLQSRELGSIYESLLELHPQLNIDAGTFKLKTAEGNSRKTTGCYYTPESLVQTLLQTTLDPVLDKAARQPDPEAAILNLKICDTACGSGHFLTAAAQRMAKRLATLRTGEEEPGLDAVRTALRQVISRCIYGVDVNRMAVELCKVALWMEAMEPGKPLPFLEHHIQWGNSLIGATPALMASGIPDDAFKPIRGDDKALCRDLKRQNKREREQAQLTLVDPSTRPWGWLEDVAAYAPEHQPWQQLEELAAQMAELDGIPDESIAQVQLKQRKYQELLASIEYRFSRFRADSWCAAFVWRKTPELDYALTEEVFRKIKQNPYNAADWLWGEVESLQAQYHFFHWHVAFAHIFRVPKQAEAVENEQAGWSGGFDVELGNTPWERIKVQEREWFAAHRPDISNAVNATERKRKIQALKTEDPYLYLQFIERCRQSDGESHFIHHSGKYPLCGRGDINTFAIFAEINRLLLQPNGRLGCIVPSSMATADTTKYFFQDLMASKALVSYYDFENRAKIFFPAVDSRMRFALMTLSGSQQPMEQADFVFFAHRIEDLAQSDRHIHLTLDDINLLNPGTKTCLTFRSQREFAITRQVYQTIPVLGQSDHQGDRWQLRITQGLFSQTADIGLLKPATSVDPDQTDLIRCYEARMISSFNHREGSAGITDKNMFRTGVSIAISDEARTDPYFLAQSRYWASPQDTAQRIPKGYPYQWLMGFKDVTSATNTRTMIACVLPKTAVLCSIRVVFLDDYNPPSPPTPLPLGEGSQSTSSSLSPQERARVRATEATEPKNSSHSEISTLLSLLANWNSFCFDFFCRQSTPGNHLSDYIVRQLPTLPPSTYQQPCPWDTTLTVEDWILPRVLELTYTAWDLQGFAKDCGYEAAPFPWNPDRRSWLQAELDAAFFHLYSIQREDVDFMLESFPIVKRKDRQKFGSFQTKDRILRIYDQLAAAMKSGVAYHSNLGLPPNLLSSLPSGEG